MTSLRHLYRLRIRSRLIVKHFFIALNIVYRNNKYMIQLLVSINVAYITITRPVIKDRQRSQVYGPNSLPHRPRLLAEFTKAGRDRQRPRSPATVLVIFRSHSHTYSIAISHAPVTHKMFLFHQIMFDGALCILFALFVSPTFLLMLHHFPLSNQITYNFLKKVSCYELADKIRSTSWGHVGQRSLHTSC